MKLQRILSLLLLICTTGCMRDDELWDFQRTRYSHTTAGVFVVNEGNFTYGNASLTYYDPSTGEAFPDVFFSANALPLGDVAHSMTLRDSLGYIVINNSGRVYVIDTRTFELRGKITGLTSPRYIHFVDQRKAYVTDLYSRSISVVDPVSLEVAGMIDVRNGNRQFLQHSTERMISRDPYVYVNCWSYDRQILIIDSRTDRLIDSIGVIKQPQSMTLDQQGDLWVLSDGGFPGSPYGWEPAGLMKVPAGESEPVLVHRFPDKSSPSELTVNGTGDTLYYLDRHVYRLPVGEGSGPEVFITSPYPEGYSGGFYGLGIDPVSSEVYVSDALDLVQPGVVYRFNSAGVPLDTFRAGIAPGSFCFKPARVD